MKFITFILVIYQIAFLLCSRSGLKTHLVTSTKVKTETSVSTKTKSKGKNKYKNEASSTSENSNSVGFLSTAKTQTDSSSKVKSESKATTGNKVGLKSLFSLYDSQYEPSNVPNTNHMLSELFEAYTKGTVKGIPKVKMPNGPIFWRGWVKYFHFYSSTKWKRPRSFFENTAYYTQRVLEKDFLKKDNFGFLAIPTRDYFFAELKKDSLNFESDRNPYSKHTVDTLNTDLIMPIPSDMKYHGGVNNLGEFREGFCIEVSTQTPSYADLAFNVDKGSEGDPEKWIMCTQQAHERDALMDVMIKIKMLKQKAAGLEFSGKPAPPTPASIANALNPKPTPKIERYEGPDARPYLDGYWILLWDWSQCTLKCGGGLQYQQWMCVPPKKDGRPCLGEAIRKKPCNINPCPKFLGYDGKKKKEELTLTPIIKSMPFSARPQRYIKCEVKESDVFYLRYDTAENIGKPVKYPARLILNNRTIALYTDDSLEDSVFTFNLPDLDITKSDYSHCCIDLFSMNKKETICGFDQLCGTPENPLFLKSWQADIDLFSKKCYNHLKKNDIGDQNGNDKGKGPGLQINDRRKIIRHNLKKMEHNGLLKKIGKAQDTSLKAIKKELKMEDLIRREMMLKAQEELKNLLALKKKEEFKRDCLLRALKARDQKAEELHKQTQGKLEIEKTFIEAKKDIKENRDDLRKKLADIKRRALRRKRMIEQQINLIRSEMTRNLLDANKFGSMEICRKSNNNVVKVKEYCDANFITNYLKNINCKEMDNFCYICCEHEFGNMYMRERDQCYTMCDDMVRKDLEGGDWVWTREGFNHGGVNSNNSPFDNFKNPGSLLKGGLPGSGSPGSGLPGPGSSFSHSSSSSSSSSSHSSSSSKSSSKSSKSSSSSSKTSSEWR